jgi:hypothetical protein
VRGVTVLETKRVGSFSTFVLQATDATAMKGWLDRNHFETTPSSQAWLDHYVKLGFYFVALRFEPALFAKKPPEKPLDGFGSGHGHLGGGHMHPPAQGETLRISFETPVPYYPYREPDRDDLTGERALALWLITNGPPKIPVALARRGDDLSYVRPLREGLAPPPMTTAQLSAIVGESTWKAVTPSGEGPFRVQVFEDQKSARKGFGDVVLVPADPREPSAAAAAKLDALLPVLDPGLEAP